MLRWICDHSKTRGSPVPDNHGGGRHGNQYESHNMD